MKRERREPSSFWNGRSFSSIEQRIDRGVQLGEREELPVAQTRQDPALDDLHAPLDLGLVARLAHACRQDRHAIVLGELGVGAVQVRLVAMRPIHAALQVVRDERRRGAAEKLQRPHMRAQPIGSDCVQVASA